MARKSIGVDQCSEEPATERENQDLHGAVKTLIERFFSHVDTWMPDELKRFQSINRGKDVRAAIRSLEKHRELIVALVQSRGMFLQFLSPELRADREIVRQACIEDLRAFRYASRELRSDRELVLELISKDRATVDEVLRATPLKHDPKIACTAARLHGHWALPSIPESTRKRPDVVKAALRYRDFDKTTFTCLSAQQQKKLSQDRRFVLQAVQKCPSNVLLASDDLLSNREFVLAAIRLDGHVFSWLLQRKPELAKDIEFTEAAVRKDVGQFERVYYDIRKRLIRKLPLRLRRIIRAKYHS